MKRSPVSIPCPSAEQVQQWTRKLITEQRMQALEQYMRMPEPCSLEPEWQLCRLKPYEWDTLDVAMSHVPYQALGKGAFKADERDIKELLVSNNFAASSKFAALVAAAWTKSTVIYVPAHTQLEEPVLLEHLLYNKAGIFEKIIILVEPGAHLTLSDTLLSTNNTVKTAFLVRTLTIIVRSGGYLEYLHDNTATHTGNTLTYLCITAEEQAQADLFLGITGGSLTKWAIELTLESSNAHINLKGAYMLNTEQQVDIMLKQRHVYKNTVSMSMFKGVLCDTSRFNYRGTITIEPEAHGTCANQETHTLMLSPQVRAAAIPSLEIHTHEVQCSHGATLGKIHDEEIRYFEYRGIDRARAQRLIIEGFLARLFVAQYTQVYRALFFERALPKLTI